MAVRGLTIDGQTGGEEKFDCVADMAFGARGSSM